MGHDEKNHTLALVARFARRHWKLPLRIAGGTLAVAVLMGAAVMRADENPASDEARRARLAAGGVVESLWARSVGSPYEGAVAKIAVRPGQRVNKGDLLFKMDTRSFQDALAAVRAERSAAGEALQGSRAARSAELGELEREIGALNRELAQVSRPAATPEPEVILVTDEEGEVIEVPGDVEQPEPVDTQPLRDQITVLRQELAERERAWRPVMRSCADRLARADSEVRRLQVFIANAVRRSPIDGIVTEVRAPRGGLVAARVPIVRVDNPAGYRVVTMVSDPVRKLLKPGTRIALKRADGADEGKLLRMEAGWDRDLFYHYVWVKPAKPEALAPGEAVNLVLPAKNTTLASSAP